MQDKTFLGELTKVLTALIDERIAIDKKAKKDTVHRYEVEGLATFIIEDIAEKAKKDKIEEGATINPIHPISDSTIANGLINGAITHTFSTYPPYPGMICIHIPELKTCGEDKDYIQNWIAREIKSVFLYDMMKEELTPMTFSGYTHNLSNIHWTHSGESTGSYKIIFMGATQRRLCVGKMAGVLISPDFNMFIPLP